MEGQLFVPDEIDQMDVEDEVVAEIPVYLNNRVGSDLMLLQYPTRSKAPADADPDAQPEVVTNSIKVKKQSEVVEVELNSGLPSNLINSNAEGPTNMGIMQTYAGTITKNTGRYAVGYMRNGQLYLSFVPQTTQLRPKFAQTEVTQSSLLQNSSADNAQAPALKSVQMSVKSTTADVPRHSGVLEFWRQSNKEEPVEYMPEEVTPEKRDEVLTLDVNDQTPEVKCKDLMSSMVFL